MMLISPLQNKRCCFVQARVGLLCAILASVSALLMAASGSAIARDNGFYATNNTRWANFTQPDCSSCHRMQLKNSLVPQSRRVNSTDTGATINLDGANNRYFWRYRNQATNTASDVLRNAQFVGGLVAGQNTFDYCAVEVSEAGQGLREWRCGEFTVTKNTLPSVTMNSNLSMQVGDSSRFTVSASDDRGGLQYAATSSSGTVTVTGNGPQFSLQANRSGSATISVRVSDSDGESTTKTLSVNVGDTAAAPVTEPVSSPQSQADELVCVDTAPVGDGWGWDGVKSCQLAVDNSQSSQQGGGACVDSGVIGDGWGWDGTKSCRVGNAETVTENTNTTTNTGVCEDTGAIGDGWGWDGTKSCRVDNAETVTENNNVTASTGVCEDTGTIGDGWGWDGSKPCQIGDVRAEGELGVDHPTDPTATRDYDTSQDGQWPVCYAGTWSLSVDGWHQQRSVDSDILQYCVKKCSSNGGHGSWSLGSILAWDWSGDSHADCVETSAAEGQLADVVIYAPERIGFARTLEVNSFVRGGGKWDCKLQARWSDSETFYNTGFNRTLMFQSDGSLNSAHQSEDGAWSVNGRELTLHLSHAEVYRNVVFKTENGTENMTMYLSAKNRYLCD